MEDKAHYCDVWVALEKEIITRSEPQQAVTAERPGESLSARPQCNSTGFRRGMRWLRLLHLHLLWVNSVSKWKLRKLQVSISITYKLKRCDEIFPFIAIICGNCAICSCNGYKILSSTLVTRKSKHVSDEIVFHKLQDIY